MQVKYLKTSLADGYSQYSIWVDLDELIESLEGCDLKEVTVYEISKEIKLKKRSSYVVDTETD